MFWLVRLVCRLLSRLWLVALAAAAGFATGLLLQARAAQQTWGVVAADVERGLPGDELVAGPDTSDTRSLRLEAPPAAVWPWLVQMGWGRGGWYSYDRLDTDQPSAETILEEFQDLAEGDLVPTDPGGGFVARIVDPGRALVLYLDTELVQAQREAEEAGDDTPAGLQAAGMVSSIAMPRFRASWALVLEPAAGGGTWLIERMRVWTGQGGLSQQLGMPFMGLGVFLMTRKHMLGIKERAERHARTQEG